MIGPRAQPHVNRRGHDPTDFREVPMDTVAGKRATFRRMHERGFFLLPNAWDRGSAVRLAAMGFEAIASTSSGAAWAAGREDGELSLDEVLGHLRLLAASVPVPERASSPAGRFGTGAGQRRFRERIRRRA